MSNSVVSSSDPLKMQASLDSRGVVIPCAACGTINRLVYRALDRPMRCARCHTPLKAPDLPIDAPDRSAFDALVFGASVPIVVDFWAPWCGPCRMMTPQLEHVAQQQTGRVIVVKVNTDAHPDVAERFHIRSIPTIVVIRGGREAARATGVRSAADINALLEGERPY